MPEEIYFAPLADRPVVALGKLAAAFAHRGRHTRIEEHSADMYWLGFESFESQLVISTTSDEKKEVGLVTFEFSEGDGEGLFSEVSDVLTDLGFSSDPEAQYR